MAYSTKLSDALHLLVFIEEQQGADLSSEEPRRKSFVGSSDDGKAETRRVDRKRDRARETAARP